jgi:hypothetical protein
VNGGDNGQARRGLAPPYITIRGHRVALDVLSFIIGLILAFFNQQISMDLAKYVQAKPSDVLTLGEALLFIGAVLFIFGRTERK